MVTDLGFAKRARAFAEILDAPLAIVEKRRHGNLDRAEVINVIGEVHGRRAIIVDDEVDTAGTLIETCARSSARASPRSTPAPRTACCPTPRSSVSPTRACASWSSRTAIPLPPSKMLPQLKVLSVAPLIGEAIKRIHRGESVGALFSSEVSFTQEMLLWEDGPGTPAATPRPTTTTYHHRCPPRPAPDRHHRRPMSLQLHRPDGKGGLEPRAVTDENWHNQLRSPRWGAVAQGRQAAQASEPRDEPDVDRAVGRVLARPGRHHVRDHRRRLRQQLLRVSADAHRRAGRDRGARHRRRPRRRRPASRVQRTRPGTGSPLPPSGATMQRALIASGVLGLGTALVFGAPPSRPRCSPTDPRWPQLQRRRHDVREAGDGRDARPDAAQPVFAQPDVDAGGGGQVAAPDVAPAPTLEPGPTD